MLVRALGVLVKLGTCNRLSSLSSLAFELLLEGCHFLACGRFIAGIGTIARALAPRAAEIIPSGLLGDGLGRKG